MAELNEPNPSNLKKGETRESIEQIREILFGTHARSLDEQIVQVSSQLNQLEEQFNATVGRLDQQMTQQQTRIEKLERDNALMLQMIEEFNQKLSTKIPELIDRKVDKHQIGQALKLVGDQIVKDGKI